MPRYELLVRARFEAAHHLTAYRGAPEPVHGHSWRVEARIASAELGPEGYAVDFVEIQGRLEALVARFRHGDINAVSSLRSLEPDRRTAGGVVPWRARHLARGHRSVGGAAGARVSSVTVWEGPDCSATFIGDST